MAVTESKNVNQANKQKSHEQIVFEDEDKFQITCYMFHFISYHFYRRALDRVGQRETEGGRAQRTRRNSESDLRRAFICERSDSERTQSSKDVEFTLR